jgi:hypothetical protein
LAELANGIQGPSRSQPGHAPDLLGEAEDLFWLVGVVRQCPAWYADEMADGIEREGLSLLDRASTVPPVSANPGSASRNREALLDPATRKTASQLASWLMEDVSLRETTALRFRRQAGRVLLPDSRPAGAAAPDASRLRSWADRLLSRGGAWFLRPREQRQTTEQWLALMSLASALGERSLPVARSIRHAPHFPRSVTTGIASIDLAGVPWSPWPRQGDERLREYFRQSAMRRMVAVKLACALYYVDHGGQAPQKLSELVPFYLPAIPQDPFAPEPATIAYIKLNGMARILSVFSEAGGNMAVDADLPQLDLHRVLGAWPSTPNRHW